jgi:S1-C subfamily serine protease
MTRVMFVYLSGIEKGKTRIFTQDHVTVGTSDASDLKLAPEEGGRLPVGVVADLYSLEGVYQLVPRDSGADFEIAVNGASLRSNGSAAGYNLQDGDTLHFGHGLSGASLLFQVLPENFDTLHPVARGLADIESSTQSVTPHPLTATLFIKELTSSLWAEIPRRAKVATLGLLALFAAIFVGATAYFAITLHRSAHMTDLLWKEQQLSAARRDQEQELIRKQQQEIDRLRQQSDQTRLFAQKIAERYSPGVCLVVGSYGFAERGTGRPLKYESADNTGDTIIDKNGNLLASIDGNGPPVRLEFSGTGFVVEQGLIATNKHVVQPWTTDQTAELIMQQGAGFRPRLDQLVAFFPSSQQPFELKVADESDRYDIALCSFPPRTAALPVLPLSAGDLNSAIGEPVVLLGYPTGVDGLLQRIDETERKGILSQHGRSVTDVATGLAARGLVRPLTTTGIVSDALPGRIVHSAHTTEGGSGGPLFDTADRVIAINSAILTPTDGGPSFGGSNFGVPIKAVTEILQELHQKQH